MEIPIPDYYWHGARAQIGAFKKGWIAASEGKPCISPYQDKRGGYHNNITFSRSFIVSWEDGWRKYHAAQLRMQPTSRQSISEEDNTYLENMPLDPDQGG